MARPFISTSTNRIELPWAVPKRKGFTGSAPGLYFWYYRTRAEAEKTIVVCNKKNIWHGAVEYRPGECYQL